MRTIGSVEGLDVAGVASALPIGGYAVDIDSSGDGWVRVGGCGRARVSGTAGLAGRENEVPEPIRQGILRLVAHLFTSRDGEGGEPPAAVALIEADTLRAVELPAWTTGAQVTAEAGNLSGSTSSALATVSAECLRPPAPVALAAERVAGGDLAVTWIRRSRCGFAWVDGVDAPLGETRELYRVMVDGQAGSRTYDTERSTLTIAAADAASLGPGEATIQVCQVGDWAASRPATITTTL